ncbi:MAG: SDR family oxidoreductase [Ktedonobacteraceae bacterium]|nr:SDR family oxidoreductase [Ktedonobacteraceae bacterium]
MRLAIFGATGRTGKPLVEQALEAGHDVAALVRTPAKMTIQNPRLTVVQGDAMNAADVEKVVQGADAVLIALGHSKDSPKDMQTVATGHIVAAMEKYGVKRIVSLTGAGVDAPEDKPKLMNHVIKFALKTMSGDVLKDGERHAALIRNSGLDWVIARGPMLNEGPHTGKYRVGWVGVNTSARISRADVADFMLKQTTDTTYLHQLPMISD